MALDRAFAKKQGSLLPWALSTGFIPLIPKSYWNYSKSSVLCKANPIQILLQANLSQEDSKSGVSDYDNLCRLLEKAQDCQWLSCRGLMTMAAATDDANEIRKTFSQLRTWLEKLRNEFTLATFTELSMGMSSDYRIAIAEGATMVRLGTALFGERNKPLTVQ
jgi:pyridoxal phosphate enzyme (YggS family)